MTAQQADPNAVAQAARDWDDDVLECRSYGHNWAPHRATWYSRERYYYVVQLCPRCTTQRHMELSESGHVFASWMVYPDGYLLKGLGRIGGAGRDVVRLATIERTFDLKTVRKASEPHSSITRRELTQEAS